MAITKIREVPTELPHAQIYLDDIEEISNILLETVQASKRYAYVDEKDVGDAVIEYTVDDTRMDTIDELARHGGSSKEFTISVKAPRRYGVGTLRVRGFMNRPMLHLGGLEEQEQWNAYGKIHSVFGARQLRIKNLIGDLPGWLKVSAYALFMLAPSIVAPALHLSRRGDIWAGVAYLAVLCWIFIVLLRPSRVYFSRSRERSVAAEESRSRHVRDIIFLALGAAVGRGIDRLISWILK